MTRYPENVINLFLSLNQQHNRKHQNFKIAQAQCRQTCRNAKRKNPLEIFSQKLTTEPLQIFEFSFLLNYCPLKSFLYVFFTNWIWYPDHTVQPRIFKFGIDVQWVNIKIQIFTFFLNFKKIQIGGGYARESLWQIS